MIKGRILNKMEKRLICPNCGEPFEIDEKGYAAIAKQVRDKEFKAELTRQQASMETEKKTALELAKSQTAENYEKQLAKKQAEIQALIAQRAQEKKEQELAAAQAEAALKEEFLEQLNQKDQKITELQAQGEQNQKEQELAVAKAEAALKEQLQEKLNRQAKELADLHAQAELTKQQIQMDADQARNKEQTLRESYDMQLKQQKESYDAQLKQQKESYGVQLTQQQENYGAQLRQQKDSMEELKERYEAQLRQQEKSMKERYEAERQLEEKSVKERYEIQLKDKDELIEYYRDLKSKQSTKMVGETLEQHCEISFNQVRAIGFQNAYFEKDNEISKSGSKGDYIFRDYDENGLEYISIMFEMKNENETTATKHKNADFLKELDKDRKEKGCEYAVLVTLLEADNDYYNTGIVDMSHKYPKMYVIRPQFFIQMITILRNAAMNSLQYKRELEALQNQNLDITHFEEKLLDFKDKFGRNYTLASERFQKAIDEIDKTIDHLQKVKDNLLASENNLRLANNKLEDLTIKKLTWKNPTMQEEFAKAREAAKLEQQKGMDQPDKKAETDRITDGSGTNE